MDNKIIIQLIKREINELTLLVDALENTTAPQDILIDVTTSKVETLSEVVSFLHKDTNKEPALNYNHLNLSEKSEEDIIQSLVEKKSELQKDEMSKVNTESKEEEPAPVQDDLFDQTENDEEIHTPAPEPSNLSDNTEEKNTDTTSTQPEETNEEPAVSEKDKSAYKKVLGDQFTKEKSLNEKFTSLTETKYKVMGKPVTSVKKAIGLNDRFMYTRELFNNDSGKFNDTVEAIDNANDLVEAVEYLEKNCEWPKNETSLKFMDLVKRRFNN